MSSFSIKIFGILLMVLDHVGYFFPNLPNYIYLRMAGRLVAPIFFFLLVEGFIHTKDVPNYKKRLLKYGLIMLIGNIILKFLIIPFDANYGVNSKILMPDIFLTMYVGILILERLEKLKKEFNIVLCIQIGICLIIMCFLEFNLYAFIMVVVFYWFRTEKIKKYIIFIIFSLLISYIEGAIVQPVMIFAIVFFELYNGKLGYKSKYSKLFFYRFYIIHIWIIILTKIIFKV